MKTQLLALVVTLAASPAYASLGISEEVDRSIALQPAAFTEPLAEPRAPGCGKPQNMMLILRDVDGAIVARAIVQVTPDC
jgi:hypothetical protein